MVSKTVIRPIGYLQARSSIWTRDCREQIQLAFREGLQSLGHTVSLLNLSVSKRKKIKRFLVYISRLARRKWSWVNVDHDINKIFQDRLYDILKIILETLNLPVKVTSRAAKSDSRSSVIKSIRKRTQTRRYLFMNIYRFYLWFHPF